MKKGNAAQLAPVPGRMPVRGSFLGPESREVPWEASEASKARVQAHEAALMHRGDQVSLVELGARSAAKKTNQSSSEEDDDDEDEDEDDGKDKDADSDDEQDDSEDDSEVKQESKETAAANPKVIAIKRRIASIKEELRDNKAMIHEIKSKLDKTSNQTASKQEISSDIDDVTNETSSPALGSVLGKMWTEMRQYSWPFYTKYLLDELNALDKERTSLLADLDAEQEKLERARRQGAKKNGKEKKDSKKASERERAVPKITNQTIYKPLFTEDSMPDVSPVAKCIITLTVVYFLVYGALAIMRTVNQLTNRKFWKYEEVIEDTSGTFTYAPSMCVLFLAIRMRAIFLSKAQPEKHGLPQTWVHVVMFVCTAAVIVEALLVLVHGLIVNKDDKGYNKHAQHHKGGAGADVTDKKPEPRMPLQAKKGNILAICHCVCMVCLYGGFIAVCVGLLCMEPPKAIWKGKEPPTNTIVVSLIILIITFFAVYLAHTISWIINRIKKNDDFRQKVEIVLDAAREDVNLAPMLSILFLGARMRSQEVHPANPDLQPWATRCIAVCAGTLLVQVIATMSSSSSTKMLKKEEGSKIGEVFYKSKAGSLRLVRYAVRYFAMLVMYVCVFMVMIAVFLLHSPQGKTPNVAPALECAIILTVFYFTAHTFDFVITTVRDFKSDKACPHAMKEISEAGLRTVMFAPMLAILFFTARMRALQLTISVDGVTPREAGPQPWVQDAMYLATWATGIQWLMAYLAVAILGGGTRRVEDEVQEVKEVRNSKVGVALDAVKYFCLFMMLTGTVFVIVGIFVMTPEALPPYVNYA